MRTREGTLRAMRVAAFGWFAAGTMYWIVSVVNLDLIASDARIYLAATESWLRGGDPWASGSDDFHFAAPPIVLLPLVPLAVLGERGIWGWMALTAVAAVWILRTLGLPAGWLYFPPLVQGLLLGNPIVVAMALAMGKYAWLAPLLRPQVIVLVLTRPRVLAVALIVTLLTVPILPWAGFLEDLPQIASRYVRESGNASAFGSLLFVPTAVALVVLVLIDGRQAIWLFIPAITPASGFYNGILALPLRNLWLGAMMATPVAGAPAVATIAYAAWRLYRHQHAREPGIRARSAI